MRRVYFFESIAPVVKQSPRYPKLSRKPEYVVAGLHLLESLASKFVTVSLPFLSLHFAAPFSQSVHHKLSHSRGSLQLYSRQNVHSEPPVRQKCASSPAAPPSAYAVALDSPAVRAFAPASRRFLRRENQPSARGRRRSKPEVAGNRKPGHEARARAAERGMRQRRE